jgi:hypothetical protein
MDDTAEQDRLSSFMILNYLNAGYQGALLGQQYLKELGYYFFTPDELTRAELVLGKVTRWGGGLLQGVLLVSKQWSGAETFEAVEAFDALGKLRADLTKTVEELRQIFAKGGLYTSADDVKFVVANVARLACSKRLFIQGCIDFGTTFALSDMVASNEAAVAEAEGDLTVAANLFLTVQGNEPLDRSFFDNLSRFTTDLPHIFATQSHDLSILAAYYEPTFDFVHAGIQPQEAERWKGAGFEAREAGFWRAYEMGPEEADAWKAGGIEAPGIAFRWRAHGFNPSDSASWAREGIPPALAQRWQEANYSPTQTRSYLLRNILEPPVRQTKG